jgi:hypothetical protein
MDEGLRRSERELQHLIEGTVRSRVPARTMSAAVARSRATKVTRKARFPLRFEDDFTPRVLKTVAKAKHTSVNALILSMIARELPHEVESVESDLEEAFAELHAYERTFGADWKAFARAEIEGDDPIHAERTQLARAHDPHGIRSIFARPPEER